MIWIHISATHVPADHHQWLKLIIGYTSSMWCVCVCIHFNHEQLGLCFSYAFLSVVFIYFFSVHFKLSFHSFHRSSQFKWIHSSHILLCDFSLIGKFHQLCLNNMHYTHCLRNYKSIGCIGHGNSPLALVHRVFDRAWLFHTPHVTLEYVLVETKRQQ